jgi:hypothetical protein
MFRGTIPVPVIIPLTTRTEMVLETLVFAYQPLEAAGLPERVLL